MLGQDALSGLKTLSDYNLAGRVIGYKEDPTLTEGLIINQNPSPHSAIRSQQTVFLILSSMPSKEPIPSYIGCTYSTIQADLKKNNIDYTACYLPSNYPSDTVIAEYHEINGSKIALRLYISGTNDSEIVIVPCFKNKLFSEVSDFLTKNTIQCTAIHLDKTDEKHECENCKIVAQKPLAGSYINAKKPPIFQLQLND